MRSRKGQGAMVCTPEMAAVIRAGRSGPSVRPLAYIGRDLGISDVTVRRMALALGVDATTRGTVPLASDWPAERIAELRALWTESSLSAAEIGRRLGVSRNAVVGKAHRLGLPARPSPIIRDGRQSRPRLSRAKAAIAARPRPAPKVTLAIAAPPPPPSPSPLPSIVYRGRSEPCCWPMGEPGTGGFRFCDAPSDPGSRLPYCRDHVEIACVARRARPSLQEAA